MNPSLIVAFAVGILLLATGGQCLICGSWMPVRNPLVCMLGPSSCYGPEVHVSGDNWRLCCNRFDNETLTISEPIESFNSARAGARSFEKCTQWMDAATVSRVALDENACNSSLISRIEDGEMRICCV